MATKRKEPKDPMTYKEYGTYFGTKDLIKEVRKAKEGDKVEIDYKSPNGLEVSKIGSITDIDKTENSIDIDIETNGPKGAYLHINSVTNDVYFAPPSRKRTETQLLLFDVK